MAKLLERMEGLREDSDPKWKAYSKARTVALKALIGLRDAAEEFNPGREHWKWWIDNGFDKAVEELSQSLRRNPHLEQEE